MSTKIKVGLKDIEREYGQMTFARALESYRLGEDITQKDFAKKLGISAQSLCDLEKGRKIPSPERAAKIARKIHEPEVYWVKLAIQDLLQSQRLEFEVDLHSPRKKAI